MNLKDKAILVTGASSGIGQAIAIEAAKEQAIVLVHFHKNKKGAEETLKEVSKYSTGDMVQADLSNNEEVIKLFKEIKKRSFKRLDLLVNNAGEAVNGKFNDYKLWHYQLSNIFLSQVYTSNEFIKFSTPKDLRKIVNISSVYGIFEMSNPNLPQYNAAKAAVNSFTVSLAKEYAPNILVNAVAPGFVWTKAWEGTAKEEKKLRESLTKINRFIEPQEIATMVLEILKNDAITGEIIRVDGGLHLLKVG
jgi:3-oxoacyl-[acyl-carrier protein] reductase